MPSNPKVKELANRAAIKIKLLTEAHQTQIEEIYREYRQQVANIQGSNADEMDNPSVTPIPQSTVNRQEE